MPTWCCAVLLHAIVALSPADPRRFLAFLESLSYADYSMAIKSGVHFTLCGGTVAKLGTAKHHESILPKLNTLELTGCFGMTELGHGSNVMGIETTVRRMAGRDGCTWCTAASIGPHCRRVSPSTPYNVLLSTLQTVLLRWTDQIGPLCPVPRVCAYVRCADHTRTATHGRCCGYCLCMQAVCDPAACEFVVHMQLSSLVHSMCVRLVYDHDVIHAGRV
jgi:hypothetical protein